MSLIHYQHWSRGLHLEEGVTHKAEDAAARLLKQKGNVEIFHEAKFELPKTAKLFTIGSCFARNIEQQFVQKKYRVLSTELKVPKKAFNGPTASTVLTKFNTHSMLTELEVAFEGKDLPEDGLIEIKEGSFWNPQLHRVPACDKALALEVKDCVTKGVKKIAEADVVIITLGLTEYWLDTELDVPLNGSPIDWRHAKKTNRFKFKNAKFQESYTQAKKLCDLIFKICGEGTKIIVTVSPVPLQRTFSKEDIIVANSYSKSTLRSVARELVDSDERIDYFPSYEIVMNSPQNHTWKHDQRHVEGRVVQAIVNQFEQTYFTA